MNESLNTIEVPDKHGLGGKQTWWACSYIFKEETSPSNPIVAVVTRSQQNAIAGYALMFVVWLLWANDQKELIASKSMVGVLVGVSICSAISACAVYIIFVAISALFRLFKPKKV